MYYLLIGADILMGLTGLLKFSHLPPQIPLFYSKPWGEDQLADLWMIILLPILMHVLFFFNKFVTRKFFSQDDLVKKIMYYLNIGIIVGITFIFIRIIFLVG